jgi:hypothetical protein
VYNDEEEATHDAAAGRVEGKRICRRRMASCCAWRFVVVVESSSHLAFLDFSGNKFRFLRAICLLESKFRFLLRAIRLLESNMVSTAPLLLVHWKEENIVSHIEQ